MATIDNLEAVTFVGVRNGRPVFDFGNTSAPPKWLIKRLDAGKMAGEQFVMDGKPLEPGQEVRR